MVSAIIHSQDQVPLLIDAKALRSIGCGQIDVATICPKTHSILIYEVKSTPVISSKQKARLLRSAEFLASYIPFNVYGKLVYFEYLPKGVRFINLF